MTERRLKSVLGAPFEERPKINDVKMSYPPRRVLAEVQPGTLGIGPHTEGTVGLMSDGRGTHTHMDPQDHQVGSVTGTSAQLPWSFPRDHIPSYADHDHAPGGHPTLDNDTPELSTSRFFYAQAYAQASSQSYLSPYNSTPQRTRQSSRHLNSHGPTFSRSFSIMTPGTQSDTRQSLAETTNLPYPASFTPAQCMVRSRDTPFYTGPYRPGSISRRHHAPSSSRTLLNLGSEAGGRDTSGAQNESRPGGPVTRSLTKWVDDNICRCDSPNITPANFLIQVEKFLTTDKEFAKYGPRWDRNSLLDAIRGKFPGAIDSTSSRPAGEPPVITGLAMRCRHVSDVEENDDDLSTQIDGSINRASVSERRQSDDNSNEQGKPNYDKGAEMLQRLSAAGLVANSSVAEDYRLAAEGLADMASHAWYSPPVPVDGLPVVDDEYAAGPSGSNMELSDPTTPPLPVGQTMPGDMSSPFTVGRKRARSSDDDEDDHSTEQPAYMTEYMEQPVDRFCPTHLLDKIRETRLLWDAQVDSQSKVEPLSIESKVDVKAQPAHRKRANPATKAKGKNQAKGKGMAKASMPGGPAGGPSARELDIPGRCLDEADANDMNKDDPDRPTKEKPKPTVKLKQPTEGKEPGVDCLPSVSYRDCCFIVIHESKHRRLRIKGIYEAFKQKWPYFATLNEAEMDSLKNSVRHNLSLSVGEMWVRYSIAEIEALQSDPDNWVHPVQEDEIDPAKKGGLWCLKPGAVIDEMSKGKRPSQKRKGQPAAKKQKVDAVAGPSMSKQQKEQAKRAGGKKTEI